MKTQTFNELSSVLYENRYCCQDKFDIVICGSERRKYTTNEVIVLRGPDFKTSVELSPMLRPIYRCETAVIGSDIYVHDVNVDTPYSIQVYSRITQDWKEPIPLVDKRIYFSVCSFMNCVYVIGGFVDDGMTYIQNNVLSMK